MGMAILFHPWSGSETDRITPCLPTAVLPEGATTPHDDAPPSSEATLYVPPAQYAPVVAATSPSADDEPVTVRSPLVSELARALALAEERAAAYDAAPPAASQSRPRLTPDEIVAAHATSQGPDELSPMLVAIVTFLVAFAVAMMLRAALA
jgi:hypothetical protein